MNQSRFLAYTHLKIECMLIMQKKHGYCTLVIVATKYTDSRSCFEVMYKHVKPCSDEAWNSPDPLVTYMCEA